MVLPLDLSDREEALALVEELAGVVGVFKVGFQLFTACGPEIVSDIRKKGGEVFLDVKYHDIPNTVKNAGLECLRLGVKIFNIHAAGGKRMMADCAQAVKEEAARTGERAPIILAVTLLTSIGEQDMQDIGLDQLPADYVKKMALLAKESGIDGVVCSPLEAADLRGTCGEDFVLLTPGVRPAGAARGDQQRVATPAEAVSWGADYLVVGRPIMQAEDRREAAENIVKEIEEAVG